MRPTDLETKTFTVVQLLAAIRAGRVRIPRFQRGFRWQDDDRLLFFDSIEAGFPVGTLLLAEGEAPEDRVVLAGFSSDVPKVRDALWVVDGQQRLTTLAMALLGEETGGYRPLFFDLEENAFVLGTRRRAPKHNWVPTSALTSSATLNRWLRDQGTTEELSNRADEAASRLREYTIPAYLVPFDGHDDQLLREVFGRVNRGGRALQSFEVFEAMHASTSGQVSVLDRVIADLAPLGFGPISKKAIERAATAVADLEPGKDLDAQARDAKIDVPELMSGVTDSLSRAISFLAADVGCPHETLLPYEGTLATLARFFALHPSPHPRNRELLARWFWRGTLTGFHRTDYSVDRKNWRAIAADEDGSVQRLLKLLEPVGEIPLPTDLHRPFRRNIARVQVELLALFALGPLVLVGPHAGEPCPVATEDGVAVASLGEGIDADQKTTGAHLLHPPFALADVDDSVDDRVLATHLLDRTMLERLRGGERREVIREREARLLAHVRAFVAERTGYFASEGDHRPLDSYLEAASE